MAFWIVPLAAMLLYLFLISPSWRGRKRAASAFPVRFYAHRGLHGKDAPENALIAFERAAEQGYGIELDVRLTRDRAIVVHHDDTALRLCGVDRPIGDMTLQEVQSLRLAGSSYGIPTLREVCDQVRGRSPLLIEMKSGGDSRELPRILYELMAGYEGVWCVESFDPRLLWWFRRNAPGIVRGQLACDFHRMGEETGLLYRLAAHLTMNFLSRPDFIAYGWEGDRNPTFRAVKALFHPVTAAWTVKDEENSRALRSRYDVQIFEGFRPDNKNVFDE